MPASTGKTSSYYLNLCFSPVESPLGTRSPALQRDPPFRTHTGSGVNAHKGTATSTTTSEERTMQPTVQSTHTGNGTSTGLAPIPFTLPSRTLVSKGAKKGVLATTRLEEARDHLRRLSALQDAEDHERSLDQLHVSFTNGHMEARLLNRNGIEDAPMLVTDVGAGQLARDVLPSRFFGGLRDLATMDPHGEKLATMAWAKFATKASKPRLLRTINVTVDKQVRRAVRSCHSQGYAPYSNLQFVEDMLSHAGEFASLPVLHWTVTDSVMRIRFAGCEGGQIELNKATPMIEAWNSEVGLRRVGLRGGMFKLVCTNGMGHWDEKKEWNWIHSGNADRIQVGVRSAFEDLLVSARGVVDAYQTALDTSIDDAFRWMEMEMGRGEVSQRTVVAAQMALNDPTTTPGGKLASVVDAITLIAQEEGDLIQQYELEKLASSILRRGLSESLRNEGRILVPA